MKNNQIYYNLLEFEKQKNQYYEIAENSEGEMQIIYILKFCLFLLKNYDDGIIGHKKMSYDICGLFTLLTDGHPLDNMIGKACDLELPDENIDGNPHELFEELIDSIEHIAKEYGVELDEAELHNGQIINIER